MAFTLFGLTGGIACGKSTVARILEERGLPVIDADMVAREVVAPGSDGLVRIAGAFGRGVLDHAGALDRKAMAALVFENPTARRTLEQITHPLIRQRTLALARNLRRDGHPLAAYEAALLVENGLVEDFRPLVVVSVDPRAQIRRLMRRDGIDERQAHARLSSQVPVAEKAAVADFVIDTSCSLEEVRVRTERVMRSLCASLSVDASRYGL